MLKSGMGDGVRAGDGTCNLGVPGMGVDGSFAMVKNKASSRLSL
jgi:hypothetical protein